MEVSQNIPIYTYSVTLGNNGIYILIYLKTPTLECIFRGTWFSSIFINTSSTPSPLDSLIPNYIYLLSSNNKINLNTCD